MEQEIQAFAAKLAMIAKIHALMVFAVPGDLLIYVLKNIVQSQNEIYPMRMLF